MGFGQDRARLLGLAIGSLCFIGAAAAADPMTSLCRNPAPVLGNASQKLFPQVPVDQLTPARREAVTRIMKHPTLVAQGPLEVFHGCPELYRWFLDHPDQAVRTWRRLGARCLDITDRGKGEFSWTDGQGTDIQWETVYRDSRLRVWYAEGKSKPTLWLPAVPLHAVVVLRHGESRDPSDRPLLEQQADLFLQTDSRTGLLIARLLGPSAPRFAEQGIAQLEMFFSALVWYLDRHPDRAEVLLGD
jgi:hypothetical protein